MEVRNLNLKNEYFNDMDYDTLIDPLTNMISRKHMLDYMEYLIANKKSFSFLNIDVDKFRIFNNLNGHDTGDLLIKELGKIISKLVPTETVIGRFGGDEFGLVILGELTYDEKWSILRLVHQNARKNIILNDNLYNVTLTSGIADYPSNATTLNELLMCVDKALYRGKEKGGNCYIIYNETRHKNIKPSIYNSLPIKMNRLKSIFRCVNSFSYEVEEALLEALDIIGLDGIGYFSYSNGSISYKGRVKTNMNIIPESIVESNYKDGMIKFNSRGELIESGFLQNYFIENEIRAGIIVPIRKKENYGYLLFYSEHNKIWTENSMAIALYLADLIALFN